MFLTFINPNLFRFYVIIAHVVLRVKAMKNKVFLAYARQDRHLVKPILKKLSLTSSFKDYSIPIHDPMQTAKVEDIRTNIKQSIKAANQVLVLWTKNAANSQWVHYEMGMADALDKPITVVKADNSTSLSKPNLTNFDFVSLDEVSI